jgi:hypothetical protein
VGDGAWQSSHWSCGTRQHAATAEIIMPGMNGT